MAGEALCKAGEGTCPAAGEKGGLLIWSSLAVPAGSWMLTGGEDRQVRLRQKPGICTMYIALLTASVSRV